MEARGSVEAVVRGVAVAREAQGYPPSIRELAAWMGISVSPATRWVSRAAWEGLVTYEPGRARTLALTDAGWALIEQPVPP